MKRIITAGLVLVLAVSCWGVEKKSRTYGEAQFYQNLSLSVNFGIGIPLGDFSDSQLGNAEVGGVGSFDIEYYFAESFGLGFRFSGGFFEDEDDPDLSSWVNNYQLYGRFLVPVEGRVRPFFRFGLGLSTITYEAEDFLNLGTLTSVSDPGFSMGLEGGVVWKVSKLIGLNGGIGYDIAFLEDAEVENSRLNVGYNPSYFSVNFGLSFFLRP